MESPFIEHYATSQREINKMKVILSGIIKSSKQTKSVVINDPIRGIIKCVSNDLYRFKISAVYNCMSIMTFIQLNETTFISTSTFVHDKTGHYVIKFNSKDDIVEHRPVDADVILEPVVRNVPDDVEEWRYEPQT